MNLGVRASRTDPVPADAAGPTPDLTALRGRLIRLAIKLLWNRDDAEEIVQEAFRIAFASPHRPAGAGLEPWLVRTVANLALNRRRKRRIEPLADWAATDAAPGPGATAERTEQLERLRAAIERLPDQQRMALVLRTMEQLDYDTIAAAMEISAAAVRTHVHLARRRLGEWLGAERSPETAS